jgi:hypothetical protein
MEQRVFEGTWEEVALRSHQFTGRRVRVTVLDETSSPVALDRALAPLIEDAEKLSSRLVNVPEPIPPASWTEDIADKFRRQGFEL